MNPGVFLFLLGVAACASEAPVQRVVFGSCVDQNAAAPLPPSLLTLKPDVFIFAGDNVYADTHDMGEMRAAYAKLGASEVLARLREDSVVLATWDDHDFGMNDAWGSYPQKAESRAIFLDFWQVPTDSPRRTHAGVYGAWMQGPPGKRVQVILLDVRYQKGDPKTAMDPATTLLGAEQWAWLEAQLRQPAEIRLIVSGSQVLCAQTTAAGLTERWLGYPHEQRRLFELIRSTQAAGVIFLSGDRHFGELSVMDAGVGYRLWDLTSSSIKPSRVAKVERINPNRIGEILIEPNLGVIDVDWQRADPLVTLRLLRLNAADPGTAAFLTQSLALSELRPQP